jgi:translation elongation factor EF-4
LTRRANQRHDAIIAVRVTDVDPCQTHRNRRNPTSRASLTRKRKLLEVQKEGKKKKMRQFGKGRHPAGCVYCGAEDG